MKPIHFATAVLTGLILGWVVPSFADTPVNEWTTEKANYTVKSNGINYESAPGVFTPADATIIDGAGEFTNNTTTSPFRLSKADKTVYITRGDKETGLRPVGGYYVWKRPAPDAWEWTKVTGIATPSLNVTATQIYVTDLFLNIDMEFVSTLSGPRIAYIVTSKDGYPSAASLGYDPDQTWFVIVHEWVGFDTGPDVYADDVRWLGVIDRDVEAILFDASKDWTMLPTVARSSDDPVEETKVQNALIMKNANRYLAEGVKYTWFLGKTLPVRIGE